MSIRYLFALVCLVTCTASVNSVCAQCLFCRSTKCDSCDSNGGCDRCCRGNVIKIKRSVFGASVPANQAMIVSSVPAITVSASAVPIQFNNNSANASTDIDTLIRVMSAMQRSNAANSASAAGNAERCEDPCGDIKQLKHDVDQLNESIRELQRSVEFLARRHVEANPNPNP